MTSPAAPGTAAEPFAPFAISAAEEKVERTVVQAASAQTRKLTVPVLAASGSLNVAVRVGVVVFGKAAFAGVTSAGTLGRVVAAVC